MRGVVNGKSYRSIVRASERGPGDQQPDHANSHDLSSGIGCVYQRGYGWDDYVHKLIGDGVSNSRYKLRGHIQSAAVYMSKIKSAYRVARKVRRAEGGSVTWPDESDIINS